MYINLLSVMTIFSAICLIEAVVTIKSASRVSTIFSEGFLSSSTYSDSAKARLDDAYLSLFKPNDQFIRVPSEKFHARATVPNVPVEQAVDNIELPVDLLTIPIIPALGAWRTVGAASDEPTTPPSLTSYLSGISKLKDQYENKVNESWVRVTKRGSIAHLKDDDKLRIHEALRIAYIAMFGKTQSIKDTEELMKRIEGVACVLGCMQNSVEVVLAGIMYEVFSSLDEVPGGSGVWTIRAELARRFGNDAILLAEKYSQLPRFMTKTTDYTLEQAENQIQMLVIIADDYRALYIRLADCLYTMRNLKSLPVTDSYRMKIADQALHVYAPLAHKMGLITQKGELEDLALRTRNITLFQEIKYSQIAANKAYHDAMSAIQDLLDNDPYIAEQKLIPQKVQYRIKGKHQLYLKMQRKKLRSPNEVKDALGLRILVNTPLRKSCNETIEEHTRRSHAICYHIVEKLQKMNGWESCEFKDYITYSKENGYQSLHLYLKHSSLKTLVEVQVRTMEMDKAAELGEAAHWYYKDLIYRREAAISRPYKLAWRSPEQSNARSAQHLLYLARKQLLESRVLCFLHDQSTVLNLRKGSTALDAAFAVHSEIGLTTQAVKINNQRVSLNKELNNGDLIIVERSSHITAIPSWLYLANTPNTQSTLKKYFKEHERDRLVCQGIVRLLFTMGKLITSGKTFNAIKIMKLVNCRSGFKTVDAFLHFLGTASCTDARNKLAIVLGVDGSESSLEVGNIPTALNWIRQQEESKWVDQSVVKDVLKILLREYLPDAGYSLIERRWCELLRIDYIHRPRSKYTTTTSSISTTVSASSQTIAAGSLSGFAQVVNSRKLPSPTTTKEASMNRPRVAPHPSKALPLPPSANAPLPSNTLPHTSDYRLIKKLTESVSTSTPGVNVGIFNFQKISEYEEIPFSTPTTTTITISPVATTNMSPSSSSSSTISSLPPATSTATILRTSMRPRPPSPVMLHYFSGGERIRERSHHHTTTSTTGSTSTSTLDLLPSLTTSPSSVPVVI